jgi:hypothetical protein
MDRKISRAVALVSDLAGRSSLLSATPANNIGMIDGA